MTRKLVLNMRDERPVWAPPPSLADELRAALPDDWQVIDVAAPVSGRGDGGGVSAAALAAVHGAEVYCGLGLPRELLRAALVPPARLRWIHTGAAGVASLLHPELLSGDVILTNSAGIHAEPIAETVLGMMLHFARGLDHAVRAQQRTAWDTAPFEAVDSGITEIAGATLGVIGYGGIGRAVAQRAAAVGMRVLALRRTDTRAAEHAGAAQLLTGEHALDTLLQQSDVIVLTVPSTPRTRGMIGAREIARLKRSAVLINVARGDIVDEPALIDALRARRLRGAALDVFATEPLPSDSPLWQLDNVLITPHVSATTPHYWQRETDLMLDNLRRYLDGAPLRNTVDAGAGY